MVWSHDSLTKCAAVVKHTGHSLAFCMSASGRFLGARADGGPFRGAPIDEHGVQPGYNSLTVNAPTRRWSHGDGAPDEGSDSVAASALPFHTPFIRISLYSRRTVHIYRTLNHPALLKA